MGQQPFPPVNLLLVQERLKTPHRKDLADELPFRSRGDRELSCPHNEPGGRVVSGVAAIELLPDL